MTEPFGLMVLTFRLARRNVRHGLKWVLRPRGQRTRTHASCSLTAILPSRTAPEEISYVAGLSHFEKTQEM
jgi:hypothetical protein